MAEETREEMLIRRFGKPFKTATTIVYGPYCGKSKLSFADVKEIRETFAQGVTRDELAERYQVTKAHISSIVKCSTRKYG